MTEQDIVNIGFERIEIARIEERIKLIQARLENVKSTNISLAPTKGSGNRDVFSENIDKLIQAEKKLELCKIEHTLHLEALECWLDSYNLPNKQRQIVHLRCVDGLTWEQIASKVFLCEKHCRRLYATAINSITHIV